MGIWRCCFTLPIKRNKEVFTAPFTTVSRGPESAQTPPKNFISGKLCNGSTTLPEESSIRDQLLPSLENFHTSEQPSSCFRPWPVIIIRGVLFLLSRGLGAELLKKFGYSTAQIAGKHPNWAVTWPTFQISLCNEPEKYTIFAAIWDWPHGYV